MTARTVGFYTERKTLHKILLSPTLLDVFEKNGQNLSDILHVMLCSKFR